MKTRTSALIGLTALAVCAIAFDDAATFKAAIQSQMSQYAAAIKKKDLPTLEKIVKANFAPEFKDTDRSGTVRNRDETIQAMQQNVAMVKSVQSVSVKILSAKVVGNKGTTVEQMKMKATVGGPNSKQTAVLDVDSTWASTYVKRNGKWLCILSKSTKEKVLLNGKPFGG